MKTNTPSWVQLLYYVPPSQKQWPNAKEWAYAIAFVMVFFVLIPTLLGA